MTKYTFENGTILDVHQDESPDNPRNWDNLGVMFCFHPHYELGDEQWKREQFESKDEIIKYLKKERNAVEMLPLYLLDHSGITIKTGRYDCDAQGWDTSFVGFIFISKEALKKEGCTKKKALEIMEQEVKTYAQYLEGDIYSFLLQKPNTCPTCKHTSYDIIDSCGGFFGYSMKENGMFEHLPKEIVALIETKKYESKE